jgi:hypothetical protein
MKRITFKINEFGVPSDDDYKVIIDVGRSMFAVSIQNNDGEMDTAKFTRNNLKRLGVLLIDIANRE